MATMESRNKAYLFAILAVLCWSTVASAFKISLRYLDPLQLVLFASFFATLFLFVTMLVLGQAGALRSFRPTDYLRSSVLGLLNPFLYYVVLFEAYSLLPAQEAQPLNYTWPMVLVLLSAPFLKQKISAFGLLAMLISFAGVLVIATRGDPLSLRFTDPLGVFLAVGSSVIWASYWILNIRDKREGVPKLFLNFLFGFVYILMATPFFSRFTLPDYRGLLGAAWVGLFEMGLAFVLWLAALKLSKNTANVAPLIYVIPFLSLVVIHFVVGERILISSVAGAVLIVGGIFLQKKFG